MRKATIVLAFIFALTSAVFACQVRETVYGQAVAVYPFGTAPIAGVRVHISAEGFAGADAVTNLFGNYQVPGVPACNSYTITATHRKYTFIEPVQFFTLPVADGEGLGIRVDFIANGE